MEELQSRLPIHRHLYHHHSEADDLGHLTSPPPNLQTSDPYSSSDLPYPTYYLLPYLDSNRQPPASRLAGSHSSIPSHSIHFILLRPLSPTASNIQATTRQDCTLGLDRPGSEAPSLRYPQPYRLSFHRFSPLASFHRSSSGSLPKGPVKLVSMP